MDPWTLAAIGGGVGLLRGGLDLGRADREKHMNAELARVSPWSGIAPQMTKGADILGNVLQGGFTGAVLGQGLAGTGKEAAAAAAGGGKATLGVDTSLSKFTGLGNNPYMAAVNGYKPVLVPGATPWALLGKQ